MDTTLLKEVLLALNESLEDYKLQVEILKNKILELEAIKAGKK
jgi:hypothetical protein